jgi:cell wall-associated NlpC family hydrolase
MIEDYIGKPFIDGGRGPKGYDCWGLVRAVLESEYQTIVEDYTISAYDTVRVADKMLTEKALKWKRVFQPQAGDIVAISLDFAMPVDFVIHVGVYIGDGRFLHTRKTVGALIERTEDLKWSIRIEGFYRYEK